MNEKKSQVVSVINFKGGVGKSTASLNLGSELADKGYKVLLIDFDAQGNLTKYSGVDGLERTIADALYDLINKRPVEHPICNIRHNLDIIGCNSLLARWIIDLQKEMFKELKLKEYVDLIREDCDYDVILIDNARDIGVDLQNSVFASDSYLIVSDMEQGGFDGAVFILNAIEQIEEYSSHGIKSAGILLNRCKSKTILHTGIQSAFENEFGEDHHIYRNVIPDSVDIGTSSAMGVPVAAYKKNCKAAEAYRRFTEEFIEEAGL